MNSKLIASLAALITSFSLMWLTLVMTGVFPQYQARIQINHNLPEPYGIRIFHSLSGDLGLSHSGDLGLSQYHY